MTPTTGLYIYAITDQPTREPPEVAGLGDAPLVLVPSGPLAAIVSQAPGGRLRPQRRHLSAHSAVLRELMAGQCGAATLPLSFGVVADGPAQLQAVLSANEPALLEQAARVAGRVEMGLRLSLEVPNVFEYLVELDAELSDLRDRIAQAAGDDADMEAVPHQLKMSAGRRFEAVLGGFRQAQAHDTLAAIDAVCDEVELNDPRGESALLDAACLVPEGRIDAFDDAVERAAEGLGDEFAFSISGPWAPHHFVRLELDFESCEVDGHLAA